MPSTKSSVGPSKKSRRSRIVVPVATAKVATPAKPTVASASKKPERLSALDAAAEVLGRLGASEPGLGVKDLIERMEKAGLWKSPGGKTPEATLYSALIREITQRKTESRFKRIAPGKFSLASLHRANRQRRTGVEE